MIPTINNTTDIDTVAQRCRDLLPFTLELGPEYGYQNLPLCVLDSVWSIGVRYGGVQNVVKRYCDHYRIDDKDTAHTIDDLVANIRAACSSRFAAEIVLNSQRTSSRGGIF